MKSFYWSDNKYSLQSKRWWNAFFEYAVFVEVRSLDFQKVVPRGAGVVIQDLYALSEQCRNDFDHFDNWWNFHRAGCDMVARDMLVDPSSKENVLDQYTGPYDNRFSTFERWAIQQKGYSGPTNWNKRVRVSHLRSDVVRKAKNLETLWRTP